jgi:hypothetical protein
LGEIEVDERSPLSIGVEGGGLDLEGRMNEEFFGKNFFAG